MDLGKMLAEALVAAQPKNYVDYKGGRLWGVEGLYDLTAAAEAFLAKVLSDRCVILDSRIDDAELDRISQSPSRGVFETDADLRQRLTGQYRP